MEWIDAIKKSLSDLDGNGTEREILDTIEKKGYRTFENALTPRRSLNMYLNQRLRGEVKKVNDRWVLINTSKSNIIDAINNFVIAENDEAADTIRGIIELEKKMRGQKPEVKKRISNFIERGKIAQEVKKITNYTCQICLQLGNSTLTFRKPNNEYYIETHHVEPVSSVKDGTLGLGNLMTVCANHHRQLHYGNTILINQTTDSFTFQIDGRFVSVKKIKILHLLDLNHPKAKSNKDNL